MFSKSIDLRMREKEEVMLMKFLSHEIVMLHLMTLLHFQYLDFHQTIRHKCNKTKYFVLRRYDTVS